MPGRRRKLHDRARILCGSLAIRGEGKYRGSARRIDANRSSRCLEGGRHFVKVFPCAQVGGCKYIKALHTALPQIPLIAAGGVNQQTAADFIISGATAIGVGTELIPTEAIARRQPERIRELALRFTGFVKEARERVEEIRRSTIVQPFAGDEECEV
jgi:hypothetical protein